MPRTHSPQPRHNPANEKIDPFIADNIRRWLDATGSNIEQLHNRVHERTGRQVVKMIAGGQAYGRIDSLREIAHELGLKLQDIVTEPEDPPKALTQFIDSPLAPRPDAPDHITDEEWLILRSLRLQRRELTPECYYLALQMIRKAKPTQ